MSNLKPLVWSKTASEDLYAQGANYHYDIAKSEDGYFVRYLSKDFDANMKRATGFTTIDEAKAWAWKHYNEKMQSYVKPYPTWIDASKQLPQVDVDTQFICAYDSAIEPYVKVTYFDKSLNEFDHEHEGVLAWMPIPEFKQGE